MRLTGTESVELVYPRVGRRRKRGKSAVDGPDQRDIPNHERREYSGIATHSRPPKPDDDPPVAHLAPEHLQEATRFNPLNKVDDLLTLDADRRPSNKATL